MIAVAAAAALKGKGRSGGFVGGRTPLGPDLRSQADFFFSSLHFTMKAEKAARLSLGKFSFVTWLDFLEQLSKQSPLIWNRAQIFSFGPQLGQSCGRTDAQSSFHVSPGS